MNQKEYIRLSLELHLFFDRIMKEHSLFLEAAFMEKDNHLKRIANDFQKIFSNTLEKAITLADGHLNLNLLQANELVTPNTLDAETTTSNLTGIPIPTNLTIKQLNLKNGPLTPNPQLLDAISDLNKKTLPVIQNLIHFKNDILTQVLACQLYTTNYPLLITHIMNEAKMYHQLLTKIEANEPFTEKYLYEQEIFWNTIMKEHAEFIRGLLDPSEQQLILTADQFAGEYQKILNNSSSNLNYLTNISLKETITFRDFKMAGEEGILNCRIKSLIIPLLADHVVREANHFIRLLKNLPTSTQTNFLK